MVAYSGSDNADLVHEIVLFGSVSYNALLACKMTFSIKFRTDTWIFRRTGAFAPSKPNMNIHNEERRP